MYGSSSHKSAWTTRVSSWCLPNSASSSSTGSASRSASAQCGLAVILAIGTGWLWQRLAADNGLSELQDQV